MSYESLMNNSILLQTKYSSQNDFGGWSYTYSSASTSTKCRVSPLSASERIDRTGLYEDVRYKCFCLSSASIQVDNKVKYGGNTYRVKDMIIDSSGHHKTALLQYQHDGEP